MSDCKYVKSTSVWRRRRPLFCCCHSQTVTLSPNSLSMFSSEPLFNQISCLSNLYCNFLVPIFVALPGVWKGVFPTMCCWIRCFSDQGQQTSDEKWTGAHWLICGKRERQTFQHYCFFIKVKMDKGKRQIHNSWIMDLRQELPQPVSKCHTYTIISSKELYGYILQKRYD